MAMHAAQRMARGEQQRLPQQWGKEGGRRPASVHTAATNQWTTAGGHKLQLYTPIALHARMLRHLLVTLLLLAQGPTLMVLSVPPEATAVPSGWNATVLMVPV